MLKVTCKYKCDGEDVKKILISSFLLYIESELIKCLKELT